MGIAREVFDLLEECLEQIPESQVTFPSGKLTKVVSGDKRLWRSTIEEIGIPYLRVSKNPWSMSDCIMGNKGLFSSTPVVKSVPWDEIKGTEVRNAKELWIDNELFCRLPKKLSDSSIRYLVDLIWQIKDIHGTESESQEQYEVPARIEHEYGADRFSYPSRKAFKRALINGELSLAGRFRNIDAAERDGSDWNTLKAPALRDLGFEPDLIASLLTKKRKSTTRVVLYSLLAIPTFGLLLGLGIGAFMQWFPNLGSSEGGSFVGSGLTIGKVIGAIVGLAFFWGIVTQATRK